MGEGRYSDLKLCLFALSLLKALAALHRVFSTLARTLNDSWENVMKWLVVLSCVFGFGCNWAGQPQHLPAESVDVNGSVGGAANHPSEPQQTGLAWRSPQKTPLRKPSLMTVLKTLGKYLN